MLHHSLHRSHHTHATNWGRHRLRLCHMLVVYASSGSFRPDTKSPMGCPSITLETNVVADTSLYLLQPFLEQ